MPFKMHKIILFSRKKIIKKYVCLLLSKISRQHPKHPCWFMYYFDILQEGASIYEDNTPTQSLE